MIVPVVVGLVVALPLVLLPAWVWRRRMGEGVSHPPGDAAQPSEAATSADPLRSAGALAVIGLLVVHGWLAVLLVRSDAAREDDPQRMLDAAARMTPAHYATVRRIQAHHAELRAHLGPDAAPPGG